MLRNAANRQLFFVLQNTTPTTITSNTQQLIATNVSSNHAMSGMSKLRVMGISYRTSNNSVLEAINIRITAANKRFQDALHGSDLLCGPLSLVNPGDNHYEFNFSADDNTTVYYNANCFNFDVLVTPTYYYPGNDGNGCVIDSLRIYCCLIS